jgi:hypothetical protein
LYCQYTIRLLSCQVYVRFLDSFSEGEGYKIPQERRKGKTTRARGEETGRKGAGKGRANAEGRGGARVEGGYDAHALVDYEGLTLICMKTEENAASAS